LYFLGAFVPAFSGGFRSRFFGGPSFSLFIWGLSFSLFYDLFLRAFVHAFFMIFMSQSGITEAARTPAWDAWYIEHLRLMLTVPGIYSSQRFKTDAAAYPPSLALYSIAGPEVFDDPYYLSVRGMGEWLALIDRRYYQRNLFSGLDRAPPARSAEFLLVADRESEDAALADLRLTWLSCVGIDRSTAVRGIAVTGQTPPARYGVAIYRPVTDYLLPSRAC
jgi:hypothetical protein